MFTRWILLVVLCCFGCDYVTADYIRDHTHARVISVTDEYRTVFCFEDPEYEVRDLIDEYPTLQKLAHEYVPDSDKFYSITVFVPKNDESWVTVGEFIGGSTTARGFTVFTKHIYVVIRPKHWSSGTDRDLRKTAVHELFHHVSIEMYDDGDPDHKRGEFWDSGGLVDQILDLYKKQETE